MWIHFAIPHDGFFPNVVGKCPEEFFDNLILRIHFPQKSNSLRSRYREKFSADPAQWVYEGYDCVLIVADAITRAGSTDSQKVIAAIEETNLVGTLGHLSFKYGSKNPVPADVPAWAWHQWLDAPDQIAEYTQQNQTLENAVVVWPPARQTTPGVALN